VRGNHAVPPAARPGGRGAPVTPPRGRTVCDARVPGRSLLRRVRGGLERALPGRGPVYSASLLPLAARAVLGGESRDSARLLRGEHLARPRRDRPPTPLEPPQ